MANSAAHAYSVLLEALQNGEFEPGIRLHEKDLVERVGVSRTPIREALRQLTADGFLQFQPGRGVQVAEWSHEELITLYELRAMVEGYAAGKAATRMTPQNLERLEELSDQMIDIYQRDGSPDEIAIKNNEFHSIIAEVGGGEVLRPIISSLIKVPLVNRTFRRYQPVDMQRSLAQHRELVEACRGGYAQWAESTMRAHILAASTTLGATLDPD